MDIHSNAKQKELFFNNLLILEFDKSAIEEEYRVKCNKDMFSLPNQKMFEIVTFFLFGKLSEVSKKQYSLPWPLLDKEQRREFQKTSVNYLSSIAQESNIKFPRVVLSVISTFSGDRFYELYLAFSSHVVEKTIRKNDNVSLIARPSISKHNSKSFLETLKISTMLSVEKSQEIQHISLKSFELYLKTSNNFITHIQKLKSSLSTNSSLLKEKITFVESLSCKSLSNEKSLQYFIERIFEHTKEVKKYWKQLQTFFEKEKIFWNYLFPAIKENPETFLLERAHLKLELSDSLKEHSSELDEICSVSTQEEICLLKYLKAYCLVLKLYENILLKGDLSQIKELSNTQKNCSFDSNIHELKILHEKLFTVVVSIEENNKMLLDRLVLKEVSEDLQMFTKECSSWNFSSKSFQNEIDTSRLLFTDNITNDALKTSLFTNDSGMESSNWKTGDYIFSSNSNDSASAKQDASFSESIPLKQAVDPKAYLQTVAVDDFDPFIQTTPINILDTIRKKRLKSENIVAPDTAQSVKTITEETIPKQSSLHGKGLVFDIDLDYHRTRKIRESWILEESLDSVTLPETSFLE